MESETGSEATNRAWRTLGGLACSSALFRAHPDRVGRGRDPDLARLGAWAREAELAVVQLLPVNEVRGGRPARIRPALLSPSILCTGLDQCEDFVMAGDGLAMSPGRISACSTGCGQPHGGLATRATAQAAGVSPRLSQVSRRRMGPAQRPRVGTATFSRGARLAGRTWPVLRPARPPGQALARMGRPSCATACPRRSRA